VSQPYLNCNTSFDPLCPPVQAISRSLAVNSGTNWKASTALNTSVLLPCPGGAVLDSQVGQMALPLQPSYTLMQHLTGGWWQNCPPDLACSHFSLIFQAEMIFDPSVIISLCVVVVVTPGRCSFHYCTCWGIIPNLI